MISSVGSIIFHAIRSELMFGDGIPLGIAVSGWTFAQVRYAMPSCEHVLTVIPSSQHLATFGQQTSGERSGH